MTPLCFVLMPFGNKSDGRRTIDFDAVYEQIIAPAILDAGMAPIRADEEKVGGIIHKPMFERLLLCDYAVADLTTANANVFYELGVRHGTRPCSTALMFARDTPLPFDVRPLRALPYALDPSGKPAAATGDREMLAGALKACRDQAVDSPVFQLVQEFPRPDLARLKTDVFRERVAYAQGIKDRLAAARAAEDIAAVKAVEAGLTTPPGDADPAVVVDLFLSYRAVEAWQAMVDLVPRMALELQHSVMVREQLGFALNRLERRDEAERVLTDLIAERGPSSETNGILGRVHKDRWQDARRAGRDAEARGHLRKAIDTYLAGFEADWRDAYPGINVLGLMEVAEDDRRNELFPVVRYAVQRRLAGPDPDYWDRASRLELAVLARERDAAENALADALVGIREGWEPRSTVNNLGMIAEAWEGRGEDVGWVRTLIGELDPHR